MRLIRLLPAVLVLVMSGPVAAQEYAEYYNAIDLFRVNIPGQPKIEEIRHTSAFNFEYPGRVYRFEAGPNRYAITVVNYGQRLNAQRKTPCPPGSACARSAAYNALTDIRAANDHVTFQLSQKHGEMTFIGWSVQDRVEGRLVRFINNDGTKTFASAHMHENRLYITEAVVPQNAPDPSILQQSLQFLDTEGNIVRYVSVYTNGFPAPAREEQEDSADFVKRTNADFHKARQAR